MVGDVTVVLAQLSGLLTARAGLSLAEVVVLATGRPLRSTADERAARQSRWRCSAHMTGRTPTPYVACR